MLIHFIHGYYCIYRPWQPLTYLYFPYHCISLIYFSFTKIRMFLYAQIYWLAEFGDVSCLQFNYLRVVTLTPTWEDLVGQYGRTILRVKSDKTLCPTWVFDRWHTWRDLYYRVKQSPMTTVITYHTAKQSSWLQLLPSLQLNSHLWLQLLPTLQLNSHLWLQLSPTI
jgi:hypothetical protein